MKPKERAVSKKIKDLTNNTYRVKAFIDILNSMGVMITLDSNSNNEIFIKSLFIEDSFFIEHEIINEPNIIIDSYNFRADISGYFQYEKPNICDFTKEIYKKNPHLSNDQIEDMFNEYNEELVERAKSFSKDFIDELNINLMELKNAIDEYFILNKENNNDRTERERVCEPKKKL